MIGYLEGTVLARLESSVLLRTSGGVGYQVNLPLPLLAKTPPSEALLQLYVVTVVRDNELSLYGFSGQDWKILFELLVKTSGVGPKMALALLSSFPPAELRNAILRHDVTLLSTIPGVGKKTATRLCVELADRLGLPQAEPFARETQGDLISALTNLGFPEKDVVPIVRELKQDGLPFQDQIKQALGMLGRQ